MFRFACVVPRASCATAALFGAVRSKTDKVVIGNPANGTMDPIHVNWTDIAGLDVTTSHRLAAGKVLSMMDLCASRASGIVTQAVTRKTGVRLLSATVGVTNTVFSSAILHGDAIRMDGRVIHGGGSSLGIYIRFYRQSSSTRSESPAGESFFTMVAMTEDLKAAKIVPAMELTDSLDIAMHHHYQNIRATQKENAAEIVRIAAQQLVPAEVESVINKEKPMHVAISSTRCEANRIFFSAYLNNNNTIFGGELMLWMEMHATHCARMFVGNNNVYTLGMHSVSFNEPIFTTDWVTLHATVTYVRNTTMEVDVKITVERQGTRDIMTNRASFVLINENDISQKATIPIGLDLKQASQEELHAYHAARFRCNRSLKRRDEFKKFLEVNNIK